MNVRRPLQLVVLVTALVIPGVIVLAQDQGQQMPRMGQGMHGSMGQPMDQPMMGGCPMMGGMIGQGKQGMMGQGMMGPGMMQGGTGPGMMQGGTGPGMMQDMGALFGSRVTPMMNLSADDVPSGLLPHRNGCCAFRGRPTTLR